MKKILSLTLVLFIISGLFAENKLTRYAIKSGFVKYELTGSTIGSKTIYWDDFGEKSRTEIESTTEIKVFGIGKTTNEHQVTITVKDKFWNNDLIKNEASSGTLPYYKDINDEAENMTEAEQEEYADELLASLGGEQVGSEK
ncbi:MAG: hypothetical protein U9N34_03915, partial [Candidatus Cloacimonadota bacterium]|nr:hypothetical protein [Candidatus Cloacimonadota bacterium]